MAGRIRNIKPEVLEDELASSLSDTAWRLWVSSWVLADDFGNFRASPKYLAAHVWQDSSRIKDAANALNELATKHIKVCQESLESDQRPLIAVYVVNGQQYAHIKGFGKHQRQDNRSTKRRLPKSPFEDIQEVASNLAATRGDSQEIPPVAATISYLLSPISDLLSPTSDLRISMQPSETTAPTCEEPAQLELPKVKNPSRKGRAPQPPMPLPGDFAPSEGALELAKTLNRNLDGVLSDMRDWASRHNVQRADWQGTLRTFIKKADQHGDWPASKPPTPTVAPKSNGGAPPAAESLQPSWMPKHIEYPEKPETGEKHDA